MATEFSPQTTPKRRNGHVQAVAPPISLDGPGRLRVAHVMALCALSHSGIYARLAAKTFPQPDGRDPRPFWNTRTILEFLNGSVPS